MPGYTLPEQRTDTREMPRSPHPFLYSKHPPRYRYSLTVKSIDLDDIYNALIIWGDRHLDKSYKCISHDGCQGEIEIVYRCKECGEIINKEDLKIAPKE